MLSPQETVMVDGPQLRWVWLVVWNGTAGAVGLAGWHGRTAAAVWWCGLTAAAVGLIWQ